MNKHFSEKDQLAQEKFLFITCYQGYSNQDDNGISSHTSEMERINIDVNNLC